MGRCSEKCKRAVGEIAVVGVKTPARAALVMAAATSSTSSMPAAKRIRNAAADNIPHIRSSRRAAMACEENSVSSSSSFRPETTSSLDVSSVVEAAVDCSNGEVCSNSLASCCSSNDDASSSDEMVKDRFDIKADPEVESAETSSRDLQCRTETRRGTKLKAEEATDNLDSPSMLPDAKSTVQIKMPSDSEIEEFFATAEKGLQKGFTDKYNFDVVKDVPLEGRYEWVPIKP